MFIESLIKLAETIDYFESRGEFLIDENFHSQTKELIFDQTEFMKVELEFKHSNPGPYSFGFGDVEINIFSPDQTEIQEWAAIVRKGSEQSNYRFNSIMGLIKTLSLAINDGNNKDQK